MSKHPHFRAHPWHGVPIGENAPSTVTCYIEIVPTDTVKFEIDKETGILKVDRPQKYSNHVPSLYGFIPQTFCGDGVGALCARSIRSKRKIRGDGDPIDVCVLTERAILHGDILVRARPVGGFKLIDRSEADDKIIAVLEGDDVYAEVQDIRDIPAGILNRLRHYFLTYKEIPGAAKAAPVQVASVYGRAAAHSVIRQSMEDYRLMVGKDRSAR